MNKNIFNINYGKLTAWLTPVKLMSVEMVAWLNALVFPVTVLYQSFLRYRSQKLYALGITPQVCYLEKLLNDRYDYTLRRIRIDDALDKPPTYIFREDELKPLPVYTDAEALPVYIYTNGESGDIKDDFIILVPKDILFDDVEMLTLVKGYRLASMKPKIQRI